MTGNCEYSRSNRENLQLAIQIKLSKKLWTFCVNLLEFLKFSWNFECSEKIISLIGQVFLKLLTPKYVLIYWHNRASFWKPFDSERFNYSQKLLKSKEKYFYPIFSSFCAKMGLKKLFSMEFEILGLLDNTLTANYEYSRSNRWNLRLLMKMKFSKSA